MRISDWSSDVCSSDLNSALAATANANIIMFLMFGAFFGFGMAATVLIGQSMGRGDIDAARRATGGVIGLALIFSVVIAIVGWFASDRILGWLETPPQAFALAHDYLRVTFLAVPASMLSVTLMMASRGAGDAVTPLRFMIFAVVLDIVFNPVLILGLGRSEEHTSELQSLMRISYAVFCLKQKKRKT